jgi:hypothetical protein
MPKHPGRAHMAVIVMFKYSTPELCNFDRGYCHLQRLLPSLDAVRDYYCFVCSIQKYTSSPLFIPTVTEDVFDLS